MTIAVDRITIVIMSFQLRSMDFLDVISISTRHIPSLRSRSHHEERRFNRKVLVPDVEVGVTRGGGCGCVVDHSHKGLMMPRVRCCPWHHVKGAEIADVLENLDQSYI